MTDVELEAAYMEGEAVVVMLASGEHLLVRAGAEYRPTLPQESGGYFEKLWYVDPPGVEGDALPSSAFRRPGPTDMLEVS